MYVVLARDDGGKDTIVRGLSVVQSQLQQIYSSYYHIRRWIYDT